MKSKSKLYTTREVAQTVGVSRATVQEWISTGQIEAPKLPMPGLGVRLWSKDDVEQVKAYKQLVYRKGRGEARRFTVKFSETLWQLNPKQRVLTDGTRTFVFHPVGRFSAGQRSKIVPIEWKERKTDRTSVVTDATVLRELNMIFRFIYGRLVRA